MAKRYFLTTLFVSLALIAATYEFAWRLEPISGRHSSTAGLTRIGSYAERDFGWNLEQEWFEPLLHHFGAYDHYYDMVVIGDSFANVGGGAQWQNFVANRTGWSILTLDVHKTPIAELLAMQVFRQSPPSIVVLNVVERDLDEFASSSAQCHAHNTGQPGMAKLPMRSLGVVPHKVERTGRIDWADINPGFVRGYLWNLLLRRVLGIDTTEARKLFLNRHDLFSSRSTGEVLVYRVDARKAAWDTNMIARIRCGMIDIESRFRAAGVQQFVLAIAPDKSSAYRPWLVEPNQVAVSRIREVSQGLNLGEAPLDLQLGQAIASGMKDVYLPNDTHWGSAGHKLVAEAVLAALIEEPDGKIYQFGKIK
ncbi:MAG: hypothetical protein Q8O38_01840 [Sulfurimicrobium sp.]|nr:hypothetical protein [Sulfurimicrobium sp.]